ncbi:MAG TPA: polyprenyl synthetase family protein, partial [Candidatus Krumholzibacteria bacterium]|nr:polyprenyl synthetase family protein [Candidatus Krumholzibacteria bacterium]
MDDDDLRRGRPSLHRRFDEATAVLTGDALLTLSFELLSRIDLPPAVALETVRVLSAAAGTAGLISGQALDLEYTGKADTGRVDIVERIHERKTARLIAAAMEMGAIVAQPGDAASRERARRAGLLAGSAFQIVDDVLDMTGDAATLGKTPGKDRETGKPTYAAAVGTAAALETARDRIARALRELPEAAGTPLAGLFGFLAERRS